VAVGRWGRRWRRRAARRLGGSLVRSLVLVAAVGRVLGHGDSSRWRRMLVGWLHGAAPPSCRPRLGPGSRRPRRARSSPGAGRPRRGHAVRVNHTGAAGNAPSLPNAIDRAARTPRAAAEVRRPPHQHRRPQSPPGALTEEVAWRPVGVASVAQWSSTPSTVTKGGPGAISSATQPWLRS
jgi:hypothetical protein